MSMARVVNMSAPPTATAGSNISAVLETASYIQNWDDFGVSWTPRITLFLCEAREWC
jgi:hypothetical protein